MIAVIHHLERPFLGNAAPPLAGVEVHECFRDEPLPPLDELSGVISFGGEQDAWDPALEPEAEFLREAVRREIPVLGVCLGAQLLAYAHGGKVARLEHRIIAWAEIEPLAAAADDPLLGALPAGSEALHWNQDGVEPPAGAVELLARPTGSGAEAFRLGASAWGVQFHPEVDADALDHWYANWPEALAPAGVTEADARTADARYLPYQAPLSEAIFGGFARLCVTAATPGGR